MFFSIIITIVAVQTVLCLNDGVKVINEDRKIFVYNRYNYDELIHVTINDTTEQFLDFNEKSDLFHGYPTRVHVSTSDNVTSDYPLFITATQQKGVSSWELPLVVATPTSVLQFDDVSRTLCPHDAGPNVTSVNRPSLQVTTSSKTNVTAVIKLRRVTDFFVQVDKELSLTVKPSTPKYYYFSFDSSRENVSVGGQYRFLPRFNYTIPKSVILMIESDDNICATVSIQNNSCPVFDNERDVLYQGYHLTMTTKGGITLTQRMFPYGFYVVFIVRENDDACTGDNTASVGDRLKAMRFRIIATISYREYVIGAGVTLALMAAIAVLAGILPLCRGEGAEVVVIEEQPGPSTSAITETEAPPPPDERGDIDSLSDSMPEWEWSMTRPLTVAGLARATASTHARRSDRYFWNSLTVAVVYALPVVQLLFTYQRMVFSIGDQDLCYYNFLCAHPLWSLSDFNHVFSNCGYVILGSAFMLRAHRRKPQSSGVVQHRGLWLALGLALAMEGLLSACYHLCPNKMNFQFDSSFMYVTAVLCVVILYQARHADVNARAHSTFMLIAVIMALGLFGILWPSVWFWAAFTVLHLTAGLALCLDVYYVGKFKLQWSCVPRGWAAVRAGPSALRPARTARAVLLAAAYVANAAIAAYGLAEHSRDFARHLLAVLMGNAFLYTCFYVIMKLVHKERILLHCWLYMVGAVACWVVAIVFFLDARTKWSQTPAESRQHNAVCSVLQFYDSHDVWHIASATAMYLYFNMLFTLDDALRNTPRHEIPVF